VYLQTERLTLRRLTADDLADLVDLDSDPAVMFYVTGGRATPRTEMRDVILPWWLAYYDRHEGFGFWAAISSADRQFLGWFHFRPHPDGPRPDGTRAGAELGYRLRRSAWGKGYATEGSRALIRKGFTELGVDRVFAETMAVNIASRRVMEKAGLRYLRTFHQDWPDRIPGDEHGDVEYALTRTEWAASRPEY
jgi:RimJ/RimL family protein N-acetyltransferase